MDSQGERLTCAFSNLSLKFSDIRNEEGNTDDAQGSRLKVEKKVAFSHAEMFFAF